MPSLAAAETGERELGRQLATLSRAGVRPAEAGAEVQAVLWWNGLARLGLELPLVVVHALGEVMVYEVLQPIERLSIHPAALVRAAAASAAGRTPHRRSFGIVRRALADSDPTVRREAVQALRALRFRDAFASLAQVFRESSDAEARQAALDAIGRIDTFEAGLFLLDVARQGPGAAGETALRCLRGRQTPGLASMLHHAAMVESGPVRRALEELLQG